MGLTSGAALGQTDRDRAGQNVDRLPPAAFPELPPDLRNDLEGRGCTIPKPMPWIESSNVVAGHFYSPDETDWAVLCSIDLASTLLVFRGGDVGSVDSLGTAPDVNYLERNGDGGIGFIRVISAVDSTYIRNMYEGFGGPTPPPLDHEGLDEYTGKASVVHYWYDGKWLLLQGMD